MRLGPGEFEAMSPEARRRWLDTFRVVYGLAPVSGGTQDPMTNGPYSVVQSGSSIIGSTGNPRTIKLVTGQGAWFPGGDGTTEFNVVGWPATGRPTPDVMEIVRCTRTGDTLTTTARAQEGTSAVATWAAGWQVMAGVTKKTFDDIIASAKYEMLTKITGAVTVTGTGEADLLNYTVAAGKIGTDNEVQATIRGTYINSSGSTEETRVRVYIGGTLVIDTGAAGGGQGLIVGADRSVRTNFVFVVVVSAEGAAASQFTQMWADISYPTGVTKPTIGYGNLTNTSVTGRGVVSSEGRTAVDLAAAWVLRLSLQCQRAAQSWTAEKAMIAAIG